MKTIQLNYGITLLALLISAIHIHFFRYLVSLTLSPNLFKEKKFVDTAEVAKNIKSSFDQESVRDIQL